MSTFHVQHPVRCFALYTTTLLFLTMFSQGIYAQEGAHNYQWKYVGQIDTSFAPWRAHFANKDIGYVIGRRRTADDWPSPWQGTWLLYRTTNGGKTWEHISFKKTSDTSSYDVSIQPTAGFDVFQPNIVFIQPHYSPNPYSGLLVSYDTGSTWSLQNIPNPRFGVSYPLKMFSPTEGVQMHFGGQDKNTGAITPGSISYTSNMWSTWDTTSHGDSLFKYYLPTVGAYVGHSYQYSTGWLTWATNNQCYLPFSDTTAVKGFSYLYSWNQGVSWNKRHISHPIFDDSSFTPKILSKGGSTTLWANPWNNIDYYVTERPKYQGCLLYSTDLGQHWDVDTTFPFRIKTMEPLADGSLWVALTRGEKDVALIADHPIDPKNDWFRSASIFAFTSDHGKSWSFDSLSARNPEASEDHDIRVISFLSESVGFAVTYKDNAGHIFRYAPHADVVQDNESNTEENVIIKITEQSLHISSAQDNAILEARLSSILGVDHTRITNVDRTYMTLDRNHLHGIYILTVKCTDGTIVKKLRL